jgi:cytochrome c oxidase assembly factor CtaG
MRTLATLLLLLWAVPAAAHGGEPDAARAWTFDPWVVTPLAITGLLYLAGFMALWRRGETGRPARLRRAGLYASGWLALAGALLSPLHWLGEHLFTFHMIEHEIVMAVAAPLFVLARPGGVLLWGLPGRARAVIGRAIRAKAVQGVWNGLTGAGTATVLHGTAIWLWHVPQFFDAAILDGTLHRLQHLSFFVTALLFWWALVRRSTNGVAAWHMFVTMIHTSVLGALMALAPRVLYGAQTVHSLAWGLTPLEDQQLAGIVMWVPAGTVYAGAALAFLAAWIAASGPDARRGYANVRP